jgi:hypothetical protein
VSDTEWIKVKVPEGTGGPMNREKLSKQEIAAGLRKLDGWSVVKGNLRRIFEFKDFTQAFGFMKRVAARPTEWIITRTGPTRITRSL